jgi:hypothetical protein
MKAVALLSSVLCSQKAQVDIGMALLANATLHAPIHAKVLTSDPLRSPSRETKRRNYNNNVISVHIERAVLHFHL